MADQVITTADGRTLRAVAGEPVDDDPGDGLAVFWLHGTPGMGAVPTPLAQVSSDLAIRWVSYDRPGFGGSTRQPDRRIADAARDVAAVADAFEIERFAVLGYSGGGPHALAAAALLPERVQAVVDISGPAPMEHFTGDWFAGMYRSGAAELHAAVSGRDDIEKLLTETDFDPGMFLPADFASLGGAWGWIGECGDQGSAGGPGGTADDDRALVTGWGFDPAEVRVPTLVLHGEADTVVPVAHSHAVAAHCPTATLRVVPGAGHVSILESASEALLWLAETCRGATEDSY